MNLDQIVQDATTRFAPYHPYQIQVDFIKDLVRCYENRSVGFFESPTGTGKSLSVLSGSVAYISAKNSSKRTSDDDIRSRLIVATRTHTQIKELVSELKKWKPSQRIPAVSLASRKHLCINPLYNKSEGSDLNDVCSKCNYYTPNKDLMEQFINKIIDYPMDIEDLKDYGNSSILCPYLASRQAVKRCDILFVPYQSLFSESIRTALNIDLERAYVVVDEAHNLADAINDIHTVTLSKEDILFVGQKLSKYRTNRSRPPKSVNPEMQKVGDITRLEQKRTEDVTQSSKLIKLCQDLMRAITSKPESLVSQMIPFQEQFNISAFNFPETYRWAQDVRLASYVCESDNPESRSRNIEIMSRFVSFIDAMGHTDEMGLITKKQGQLTYILLQPSDIFDTIVDEANSVVLVGGTLQPIEDLSALLTTSTNLMVHTNGHVIPQESCLARTVVNGPHGHLLNFNFQHRNDPQILDEIGAAVVDLAHRVPGGIIVFFTSYAYLDVVRDYVVKRKIDQKILDQHKAFLYEDKDGSSEEVMRRFKSIIDKRDSTINGVVLFSVMKGKLSEGINFANDYCRCVMVVGMPFASPDDEIMKQRQKHFDSLFQRGVTKCNGKMLVENLCMRAVNQAIGRCFRNINDYAAVVLFDSRYEQYQHLLPGWIRRSYAKAEKWEQADQEITDFFESRGQTL